MRLPVLCQPPREDEPGNSGGFWGNRLRDGGRGVARPPQRWMRCPTSAPRPRPSLRRTKGAGLACPLRENSSRRVMLARQLLIGFVSVIVPSTVLLGAVTFYSVRSMARASNELAEISRSDEAVTDLNMTLTQAGAPLGFFLLRGDSGSRQRFEDLVREVETKLQSCGAAPCHTSSQTPARMAAGLKPAIEQFKREGRRVFENRGDGGASRVEAGDWSYQASVTRNGEIGELASAFNAMVRELRERRAQLEDNNRTLEQRVRQRTEELRQKEQELVQSEKLASVGLLAAGVAHELNNPLTSIVMNANLMMEEMAEGTPFYEELRTIDADAGRCRRIIEDLRAFARVRQVERVPTEVDTVV